MIRGKNIISPSFVQKMILTIFRFFCIICPFILMAESNPDVETSKKPPLFISLGAHCSPSVIIFEFGCREEAYPFDWMRSHFHDRFVQIFEDNFAFFLDKNYLSPHPKARGHIYNEYYGLEFMHDWLAFDPNYDFWTNFSQYEDHYPEVFEKFHRRIERLKAINNDPNRKVVFIRMVFDLQSDDRAVFIPPSEQVIREDQGLALVSALRKVFPDIDFTLVIINFNESNTPPFAIRDDLMEYKVPRNYKLRDFEALFKHFWPAFTPPLNPQWGQ